MRIQIMVRAFFLMVIGLSIFGSLLVLHLRVQSLALRQPSGFSNSSMVTIGYPGSAICRMTLPFDSTTSGLLKDNDIWDALRACAEREREGALDTPPPPAYDI